MSTTIERTRSIRATAPLAAWRTVDILTIVSSALPRHRLLGWGLAYQAPSTALTTIFPPLTGITAAPRLVAGVVGGLVVRRPGAAPALRGRRGSGLDDPGHPVGVHDADQRHPPGLGAEFAFPCSGTASTAWVPPSSPGPWRHRWRRSTSGSSTGRTGVGVTRSPTSSSHRGRRLHRRHPRLADHAGSGSGGGAQRLPARSGAAGVLLCLSRAAVGSRSAN